MKYLSDATRGEDTITVRIRACYLSLNGSDFKKELIAIIGGKVHFYCCSSCMRVTHYRKAKRLNQMLQIWFERQPEHTGLDVQIRDIVINDTIGEKE